MPSADAKSGKRRDEPRRGKYECPGTSATRHEFPRPDFPRPNRHGVRLAVFDPNITQTSPAGSCLLSVLRAARQSFDVELFTVRTDLEAATGVVIHKMPVPMKPVFLQSIFFTGWSILFDLFAARAEETIKISTQGGFPFCDVCYAHCCHKLLLTKYRSHLGGSMLTRSARFVNHAWNRFTETIAFRRAKVIVVPSEGLADEIADCYGASIAAKLNIISNPVDCQMFHSAQPRHADDSFRFAFCALGNFEWKGLGLAIAALGTGFPATLDVIGGDVREIERFRKLADSAGVGERVNFRGMKADIRPYLWAADAFVFPSVYETFSLVCVQAAAAGLPLIATRLHGVERVLQPGVSGWEVERTVESVSAAMQAATKDRGRTAEMGRQAQILAQKYDEPLFRKRWLDLLATWRKQPGG